jgi:predicted N-acetyltransferase YhbS
MSALASPRREQSSSSSPISTNSSSAACLGLAPARVGDHLAIHQLLQHVFRGPSAAEFQLQQDEPGYSPSNRLVARDGQRIVAHARLSLREMQVGDDWLRIGRVFDLCVLPEFRNRQVASRLIAECEALARQQGAVLLQTHTPRPGLFERQGWVPLGRPCYSLAGPREVLAEMERRRWEQAALHQPSDDLPQLARPRNPLTVRRWKQTEHAAVQRLYQEGIAGMHGPLARSDDYWRWLIARGAYDWFYVAIDGPDRTLFDEIQGHIVGYMFLKANRIVELISSPSSDRAPEALLARACRDAIEQSVTPIRLDLPKHHALQELVAAAAGRTVARDADGGQSCLGKALDMPQLASATLARCAGVRLTLELREEAATIPLHRRAGSGPQRLAIEDGNLLADRGTARPQVVCSAGTFMQLLLGHMSVSEACDVQQVRCSSKAAREALEQLIVPRPLWFAPLEDLLA